MPNKNEKITNVGTESAFLITAPSLLFLLKESSIQKILSRKIVKIPQTLPDKESSHFQS